MSHQFSVLEHSSPLIRRLPNLTRPRPRACGEFSLFASSLGHLAELMVDFAYNYYVLYSLWEKFSYRMRARDLYSARE